MARCSLERWSLNAGRLRGCDIFLFWILYFTHGLWNVYSPFLELASYTYVLAGAAKPLYYRQESQGSCILN